MARRRRATASMAAVAGGVSAPTRRRLAMQRQLAALAVLQASSAVARLGPASPPELRDACRDAAQGLAACDASPVASRAAAAALTERLRLLCATLEAALRRHL